jgi:hypothetical protein
VDDEKEEKMIVELVEFETNRLKYRVLLNMFCEFMPERVLLTDEDRALLVRVSSLLEEVVESFNILEDKEAMSCIKQAEEDVKMGRVRNYSVFLKELKKSG